MPPLDGAQSRGERMRAVRRAHHRESTHALGRLEREAEGDHAAVGGADQARASHAEMVEHGEDGARLVGRRDGVLGSPVRSGAGQPVQPDHAQAVRVERGTGADHAPPPAGLGARRGRADVPVGRDAAEHDDGGRARGAVHLP